MMSKLIHFLGTRPDGRELYRYRLTKAQYDELRDSLRRDLERTGLVRANDATCALFCVFAAEWWRREHERGPWTWEWIKEALGVASAPYSALAQAVDRGLRVLQRPLLTSFGERQRLITVACEGGLPLRRLQVAGARLPVFFRDVLEHLEAVGMSGLEDPDELEAIASRYDHRLPRSLQRSIVHRLVGELVGRAWSLRRSLPEGTDNPVSALDASEPGWRDHLPLVVSDDSAQALLRGLMVDVAQVAAGRRRRLRVLATLTLGEDRARLQRLLEMPASLSDEDLESTFEGQVLPSGNRIQVRMRTEVGDTIRCGVLSRTGAEGWSFQPVRGAAIGGSAATQMVTLVAATRAGVVESASIEGGTPLGPLPWVFRPASGSTRRWELVACGSTRRREPELLVALPSGVEAEGSYAEDGRRVEGRALIRVHGEVRIRTNAGSVRVVAGSPTDETAGYELRGRRFEKVATSRTAWLGMPQLMRRRGSLLDSAELQVRDVDGWRPAAADDVGELRVRSLDNGGVVFNERIRVVPKDLVLKLEVGDRRTPGAIEVSSSALLRAGVPEDPRWSSVISFDSGRARIELTATDTIPGRVPLALVFPQTMLKGDLPFPVRTLHFETPDGMQVERDARFHFKRLGGLRAVALSPNPRAQFAVSIQAVSGSGPVPAERMFSLDLQPAGEHTLHLRDIQSAALEMLDATESLDATIRIRLWEVGGSARGTAITARRYDWTLARDAEVGDVVLQGAQPVELDEVVVEARPFANIQEVTVLQRRATTDPGDFRWAFRPDDRSGGSWLITARECSWYRCRAIPFSGAGDAPPLEGLRRCFELHRESERHEAIRNVLDDMCRDWSHPDWKVVDGYLRMLGDLPAATFDLNRVIARHPRAAAFVALRAAGWGSAEFLQVLDGFEELVFLWASIPFNTWRDTFTALLDAYPAALAEYAFPEVVARGKAIGGELPTALVALHHWARERGEVIPGAVDSQIPLEMTFEADRESDLLAFRSPSAEELTRRHSDEPWPIPPEGVVLSSAQDVAVASSNLPTPQRRVLDAPAVLARAAVGDSELSAGETLFLEEVRSFDEGYFRETFLLTFLALIARHHGDR